MSKSASPEIDLHALVQTQRTARSLAASKGAKAKASKERTMNGVHGLYKAEALRIAKPLIEAINAHLRAEGIKSKPDGVYVEGENEYDFPFAIEKVKISYEESDKLPFRFCGVTITFSSLPSTRDKGRPVTKEEIQADSITINQAYTNYSDGDPYEHYDGTAVGPTRLQDGQIPKSFYEKLARKLATRDPN